MLTVVELTTAQTFPLRLAVLRRDTPTKDVTFPEDHAPGAWHLGVRTEAGVLVATSTWVPRPCPLDGEERSIQLRGMATDTTYQGAGVGSLLFRTGCETAVERGHRLVWANARDSALGFYERCGCTVVGEGFVDAKTELPHHVVVRRLTR